MKYSVSGTELESSPEQPYALSYIKCWPYTIIMETDTLTMGRGDSVDSCSISGFFALLHVESENACVKLSRRIGTLESQHLHSYRQDPNAV